LNALSQITSATAFFARMSDANGEIAKLSLQRRHVQPGDVIVGMILKCPFFEKKIEFIEIYVFRIFRKIQEM
jgi:hypothetical protein